VRRILLPVIHSYIGPYRNLGSYNALINHLRTVYMVEYWVNLFDLIHYQSICITTSIIMGGGSHIATCLHLCPPLCSDLRSRMRTGQTRRLSQLSRNSARTFKNLDWGVVICLIEHPPANSGAHFRSSMIRTFRVMGLTNTQYVLDFL
jgi:hypothetical protein